MRRKSALAIAVLVLMLMCALVPSLALGGVDDLGVSAAINRALDYLKARQQSDGGFAEPNGKSSAHLTSWAVCAVASAGQDPASWRRSGSSPLDYLAAAGLDKLTDIEKTCLAVASAGANPRSFGGRDLVGAIKARMAPDGHIGDLINEHCWGLIALAAAGEPIGESSRTWLAARQNVDGGFGYAADSGSDPDDTGAALQGLMAAGESQSSTTVTRAISYLLFCQGSDGGFTWQSQGSNVGSTAWCVQGLITAGENVSSSKWTASGNTPLDFINRMQQGDGHFRHSTAMDSNPAWMTAEAIPAVLRKSFPIKKDTTDTRPQTNQDTTPVPTTTTTTDQVTPSTTSGQTDPSAEGGDEQGSAPTETGQQGSVAPGARGSTGTKSSPSGTDRKAAVTLASNDLAGGGSSSSGRGLTLFILFCAMYLVLLGVVYLCLKVFKI